jgi:tetratricopeptide (TPR) repeat protein
MHRSSPTLAVAISLLCLAAVAQGQFPGPGNSADWADALPYYNLANRYVEKERFDEAVEKYQQAIDRYPFDPDFYINLGFAYRKLEDYALAEKSFRQALKLNSKDWLTWSNLGNALLKQHKLPETISAFQSALKCAPPARDKALILRDIEDIKKVLAMREKQAQVASHQQVPAQKQAQKPTKAGSTNPNGGWDYSLP